MSDYPEANLVELIATLVHKPLMDSGNTQNAPGGDEPSSEIALPISIRDAYRLEELLAFSDRQFVRVAYLAVLGREPDADGLEHYLPKLRNMQLSKARLLQVLRHSEEGSAKAVHIAGLEAACKHEDRLDNKLVGPLLRWLLGLRDLARQRQALQQQVQRIDALEQTCEQELAQLRGDLQALQQGLGYGAGRSD